MIDDSDRTLAVDQEQVDVSLFDPERPAESSPAVFLAECIVKRVFDVATNVALSAFGKYIRVDGNVNELRAGIGEWIFGEFSVLVDQLENDFRNHRRSHDRVTSRAVSLRRQFVKRIGLQWRQFFPFVIGTGLTDEFGQLGKRHRLVAGWDRFRTDRPDPRLGSELS